LLKETREEKGCLYGCLWSIVAGGTLGAISGYFSAGFLSGENSEHFPLLLRMAFSTLGFLVGVALWLGIQWIYFRYFNKSNEEEIL